MHKVMLLTIFIPYLCITGGLVGLRFLSEEIWALSEDMFGWQHPVSRQMSQISFFAIDIQGFMDQAFYEARWERNRL